MELGLGSNALHLLFLFPSQYDLGPGSGFADWENPRLPHQLTAEKQESQRQRSNHSRKGCNFSGPQFPYLSLEVSCEHCLTVLLSVNMDWKRNRQADWL